MCPSPGTSVAIVLLATDALVTSVFKFIEKPLLFSFKKLEIESFDLLQTAASSPSKPLGTELAAFYGDTDIFITPGYQFQIIDALLTNFHLSESTLLMLVSAFSGYEHIMAAYQHAIAEKYRFFSYGDAMFLAKKTS